MSEYAQIVKLFKALSDENRIQILRLLQSGEKCGCELLKELNIGQSTLSHHMKILCDVGIVLSRKDGKWMHYSICCQCAMRVREIFRDLLSLENIPANCQCEEDANIHA